MGRDISNETAGFCEVGDNVEFKLYSAITGNIINLNGIADSWNSLLVTHVEKLSGTTVMNIPSTLTLNPAFPNPFNPITKLSFGIPGDGMVTVNVFDVQGRLVTTIQNGLMETGYHEVEWNGSNQPSGMYLVKVQFENELKSEKIILIK